ncbi:barstar family protein [Lactiplantibacillus pingfangensis]|uniref:barstar family protein n=1 Tax=Lactiplantibacillus pingfangensis TaxID=2559915 RepID=UPI0010F69381|nr:barstar family protein [Lactiplantibacillus pingfangensis]
MKNEMLSVGRADIAQIIKRKKAENYYIVSIPGKEIQTEKDFFEIMSKSFQLPDSDGWDPFFDWMTDLSWIPDRRICIVINNYNDFLKSAIKDKRKFKKYLKLIELFWEKEVLTTIVGGKLGHL